MFLITASHAWPISLHCPVGIIGSVCIELLWWRPAPALTEHTLDRGISNAQNTHRLTNRPDMTGTEGFPEMLDFQGKNLENLKQIGMSWSTYLCTHHWPHQVNSSWSCVSISTFLVGIRYMAIMIPTSWFSCLCYSPPIEVDWTYSLTSNENRAEIKGFQR